MTVQREDAQLELHLSVDSTGETPVESFDAAPHGIVPDFYSGLSYRKFPAKRRIVKSLKFAGSFILKLIVELVSVLGRLVIRRRETRKLGGGVVSIFSEGMGAVLGGSFKVVIFAISVSIGWGLINLVVPIPMLDGGQIVLLTYETLVAPVTPVVKSWLMAISIWIILTLFIIGLWKDVVNLVRMLKNRK